MHNRARMIVASFLVKDLLVDWRWGEKFFMQHLVDGDPAANNGGWQWTAGTGTDAAPYFRIFNPVLQGKKYDPDGTYVRHWLPELENVPDRYLQNPWEMPDDVQRKANCVIGRNYPAPIVNHARARERTLAAYARARKMKVESASTPLILHRQPNHKYNRIINDYYKGDRTMKIAKVGALLGLLAMTSVLIYGFTVGNFSGEGAQLLKMPWGIVSLIDLYVGFILFSGWIIYREKSVLRSVIWVVLMMVTGFWAGSLYTLHRIADKWRGLAAFLDGEPGMMMHL